MADASEAPAVDKAKFTARRPCPFCKEPDKTVSHQQWCQKNPNRRQDRPGSRREASKPGAPTKPAEQPVEAPEVPPEAPAPDAKGFLEDRRRELASGPPAPRPKAKPPAPAEPEPKKGSGNSTLYIGAAVLALLLLFFAWRRGAPQDEPEAPKANGFMPGVGPVHVPGLDAEVPA